MGNFLSHSSPFEEVIENDDRERFYELLICGELLRKVDFSYMIEKEAMEVIKIYNSLNASIETGDILPPFRLSNKEIRFLLEKAQEKKEIYDIMKEWSLKTDGGFQKWKGC